MFILVTEGGREPDILVNYNVRKTTGSQLTNFRRGEIFLFVFTQGDYPPSSVQSVQQK